MPTHSAVVAVIIAVVSVAAVVADVIANMLIRISCSFCHCYCGRS